MDILCTVKSATEVGDLVECSVFVLQDWKLKPGTMLEQHREGASIATWELVELTPKSLILKKGTGTKSVRLADAFYTLAPEIEKPIEVVTVTPVLVFGGKNWKLASPKKWVPANLLVEGYPSIGELNIDGKDYIIIKLTEGFAAKLKSRS